MTPSLGRRLAAEGLGTALLLATVVGSGIMGERLAGDNIAIVLLANSIATGAMLVALILAFGPVSGAHFNPVVTLCNAALGGQSWRSVPGYVVVQFAGALAGVAAAHGMFELPLFVPSTHARTGAAQWWSEIVATFGLVLVIFGCVRAKTAFTPFAVGLYIAAAYWFTASTSFANPALTLARAATDTFAGILPADVPGFMLAQLAGGAAALLFCRWMFREPATPPATNEQQ